MAHLTGKNPENLEQPGRAAEVYWFAREHKSIIFLTITLALVGAYVLFSIPIAVFPSTDFPRIVIGVDNGVMPIDQMLVTITRPVEEAVSGVQGIEDVQSITSRGSAEIDLYFSWNVNMFQTLERVNAALARVAPLLPSTAAISAQRLEFSSFPILGYGLTSDTISQQQLWELAAYDIKPRLASLSGVSTIVIQGGQVPEFHIVPDPAKLRVTGVSVSDILSAVNRSNIIQSPGLFPRNHQLYLGLISGQAHNAQQIAHIFIKNTPSGGPVYVGDVAQVVPSFKPHFTICTANGKPAVLINVNRQRGSNTLQVGNEVNAEMKQLAKTLPPGVHISTFYDQSWIVGESIKSVRDAILIGLILASAVLVLFLQDWGTAFIGGTVIPISLLVTFIVLKYMGESFNLMTLGGMAAAVGLIIDNAIVILENIVLHRQTGENRFRSVALTLDELTVPLIGSTLTPIVVFLPLIAVTGVTGVFFRALAVTMGTALLTSLILALTWAPTLCLYLLRKQPETAGGGPAGGAEEVVPALPAGNENTLDDPPSHFPHDPAESERERRERELSEHAEQVREAEKEMEEENKQRELARLLQAEEQHLMKGYFGRVIRFYEVWFRRSLRKPIWVPILTVLLIVVSYLCYQRIGSDLLPRMDEGSFIIDYVTPPGSSLQESNQMVSQIMKIVHTVPEVEATSRRTGLQLGLATVTEANTGDISVNLKTNRSRDIWSIINEIRDKVASAEPAVSVDYVQKLQDMIGDLTNAPQPIYIMMFSPNAQLLNQWAPKVADAIGNITVGGKHPVVDIDNGIDSTTSGPAITFDIHESKASHAGFSPQDVADEAGAMLDGVTASQPVVINDRPYGVRVRYPQSVRSSLNTMNNTMLVSPSGQTANLGSLATITDLPGQTEILQDNQQRYVHVTARLEGLDTGHGIAAVQAALAKLGMPPSIRIEYGGLYKTQQKSFHDLSLVLAMAVVFVFLVLLLEFRNFSAPISILVPAILSTAGVFVSLLLTGITFNLASFMGLIMVVGIVAKNGILLLDADEKFRAAGFSREEAIFQAGRRRLRPIVMTAIAAIAGMLPLALALGAGSQMLQPLAIAVIGGLLIAMVLSLFVTPTIYYYMTRGGTKVAD
ncbi:MAG TPA: efflux RND transporter permease subunit [Patescibacteria group bacterium]|nr:efflux RND transporter permease subunit [Patescibacteria group bacterium]